MPRAYAGMALPMPWAYGKAALPMPWAYGKAFFLWGGGFGKLNDVVKLADVVLDFRKDA